MFFNKEVRVNNLKIYTEYFGDIKNPACVLIAGAMSSARFWTDDFCNRIADSGYFVIRYDNRDVGLSSTIDWQKAPYTLKDIASDAIGILDSFNIDRANFIGHSMGGYICQELAVEFYPRVLSTTLISAGPIGYTHEMQEAFINKEQNIWDVIWKIFLSRKESDNFDENIQNFMPIWQHLNGSIKFDKSMAKDYTVDLLTRTQNQLNPRNNHELMMRNLHDSIEGKQIIMPKIEVPTLIIHGQEDPLILPRNAKALANSIANSKIIMIPQMGHMIFNKELQDHIANLIISFLKNLN